MKKAALLLSLALLGGSVSAEPGPLVRKLMKTEVTLLSFGLYRLNVHLDGLKFEGDGVIISGKYDWDANRIKVILTVLDCGKTRQECEKVLKGAIEVAKSSLCIPHNPLPNQKVCGFNDTFHDFFTPEGYLIKDFHNGKNSEDAIEEISAIVEYEASGGFGMEGGPTVCRNRQLETNIFCASAK